jgi:hypothetical protein
MRIVLLEVKEEETTRCADSPQFSRARTSKWVRF